MEQILLNTYHYLRDAYMEHAYAKVLDGIYREQSRLCGMRTLTSEQKKAIQDYWQPLTGMKVSTRWHRLLYSITGVFNPRYEPFEVCHKVQITLSPGRRLGVFDDKGLYEQLLVGFNIPGRVAACRNGVYYLPEKRGDIEVTFDEFIEGIADIDDCIIKPSIGTDSGRGVAGLDVCNGMETATGKDIRSYIADFRRRYGNSFCIEHKIHECDNLQCLNPSSCNTLRVHTYRDREAQEIKYLSAFIRIGKQGQIVDNTHSGGFSGRISKDGYLDRVTNLGPYIKTTTTESGIDVSHYRIDDFDKIVQTVRAAHSRLPMFDLIGWDVTVSGGGIFIIEFNPNPEMCMSQCAYDDTCLGDLQEQIVRRVYNQK